MLFPQSFLLIVATILLTTVAVAQQAQVKEVQPSLILTSSDAGQPTCANLESDSNSGLTRASDFDVFKVERSLDFPGNSFRRVGTGSGGVNPDLIICCNKESRCPGCHTCGKEEAWDCSFCGCMPI